jgi:hypothetical protein
VSCHGAGTNIRKLTWGNKQEEINNRKYRNGSNDRNLIGNNNMTLIGNE